MKIDLQAEIIEAIRHDFHKLKGLKHKRDSGLSTRADYDASFMSRPPKKRKPERGEDINNYRLSIIDGTSYYKRGQNERNTLCSRIRSDYYNPKDTAEVLFLHLLNCDILFRFNEDPRLPYTSLKYHSILTTNLHWNYILKRKFEDLYLKIIDTKEVECIFSIVFIDKRNKKCLIISDKGSQTDYEAYSHIGKKPTMNFAGVMSRIAGDVYIQSNVFANLRRIQSWSTGLQYLEDCYRDPL
jgi:hypothetical protein